MTNSSRNFKKSYLRAVIGIGPSIRLCYVSVVKKGDDSISSQMKARLNELGILDDLAQRSKGAPSSHIGLYLSLMANIHAETIQSMDDPAFRQILDVTKANTQGIFARFCCPSCADSTSLN